MVRTLKEGKFGAHCALKVLDFAAARSAEGCHRLVKGCDALKFVFPILLGHGLRKQKKAYQVSE